MPWFFVDDGFAFHRKVLQAGNAATGLWTRAGSWCAQQLTDGFVPDDIAVTLGTEAQAKRLVSAKLWARVAGGYQFHEWSSDNRNPTRESVLAKRAREAEKKAAQRSARKNGEKNPTGQSYYMPAKGHLTDVEQKDPFSEGHEVNGHSPQGTPPGSPLGSPLGNPRLPSHPLPKEEKNPPRPSVAAPPRKRGTRIPDDFSVTADMVIWARENVPRVDGRTETENFIDYWTAKPGKDGEKLDWIATWRRWMRTAQDRPARANGHRPNADDTIAALLAPTLPQLTRGET